MLEPPDLLAALFIGGHPDVRRKIREAGINVKRSSQIFLQAESQYSCTFVYQLVQKLARMRKCLEYLIKHAQLPFIHCAERARWVHKLARDVEDGHTSRPEKVVDAHWDHWGLVVTKTTQGQSSALAPACNQNCQ